MSNQNEIETLVWYGGAVKALGDGRIGGHLVLFGDDETPDLEGDYFTKETDFGGHQTTAVLYQHGLDTKLQRRVLDPQAAIKTDDVGIWVEAQLELRDEYEQAIYGMAKAGKLGWSSGTASHLVERKESGKAHHITRWPLGLDASLTPIPAEPRTSAIPLKSLDITPLEVEVTAEDSGEESPQEPTRQRVDINININDGQEKKTMSEKEKTTVESAQKAQGEPGAAEAKTETPNYATADQLKAVNERLNNLDDLSTMMNTIMERLEKSGPLKDIGYIAPDDEAGKPEVKSFGDFCLAIYRGNVRRLATVYKSTKDLSGETGTAGGYLVPEEFEETLLQVSMSSDNLVSRAQSIPVGTKTGTWPALDQFITPTAGSGQTALAAGVTATTTAAGATLTETEPGFEMIQWTVTKQGGYTEVENELVEDSPFAVEALLTSLYGVTVNAKKEQLMLRGHGAGEPQGILNSPAAVGITPATDNLFAYADALSMVSRFKSVGGEPVWIIHSSMWPDIGIFESSAGGGVWQANHQASLGPTLLGHPILQSEHLPQANNSGCVLLVDPRAYLFFERRGITVAFSEHAAFTSEKGTWRFSTRFDGQGWLKSAITLADPQGSYTVSPFVYLND